MGAAASFPDELTQEEAVKLAGDKWDEKLRTLWPEGAEKVTKEQLIAIIKDIPIFSQRNPGETGDWDETAVVAQTKTVDEIIESNPDAIAADGAAGKPAAAKVVVAPREKHDMALRRAQKLAEQNNVSVEEVMAMQSASAAAAGTPGADVPGAASAPAGKPPAGAKPPRAKPTGKSKQQSEELRALIKAQKAAAKADGRPPSRSVEDMEVQLLVRPSSRGGDSDAPQTQVFVCDGTEAEPQVLVVGPEVN